MTKRLNHYSHGQEDTLVGAAAMVMEVVTAEVMVEEVQDIREAEADGRLAVVVDSAEGEVVAQDLTIAQAEEAQWEEAQVVQVQVGELTHARRRTIVWLRARINQSYDMKR